MCVWKRFSRKLIFLTETLLAYIEFIAISIITITITIEIHYCRDIYFTKILY